jgi:hypothetical protein
MAVPRCDLTTLRGRLIAAVNAAPAATWATSISATDDNRRNDTELNKIILAADARICVARARRWGDGYRSLFLSLSASIPHGGVLPDSLGPPEQIQIKYATTDTEYKAGKFDPSVSLADIERWRANAGARYGASHSAANSVLSGFYRLMGRQLFYTGADAKAQIATFTKADAPGPAIAVCQAPESDEDMLLGLALGDAVKEGDTGPFIATIVADARAEYALLLKPTPQAEALGLAA